MPAFFVLFLFLAVRVAFLDGSAPGYSYLFKPDWSEMANPRTWVYAMGQAFFSLSLAGSGTVVYGSYLKSDVDVVSSAKYVAFFDTAAALLAGLVIIPAVFSFGMAPNSGPGLLFITIPAVIRDIPLGRVFAIIFFLAVLFAGITSLMNLLESPVEALQKRLVSSICDHFYRRHHCRCWNLRRRRALKRMDGQYLHLCNPSRSTACRNYNVLDMRR